jgi:hypothetical protein
MKKTRILCLTAALLFVLPLLCLTACDLNFGANPDILPNTRFVAKVTEVKEGQLFVTVIDKGNSSLGNGTPVYVSTNFEGYTAPAVGDYVIVQYDSMVQEIYPPIVPNVFSITKCDANGNPLK